MNQNELLVYIIELFGTVAFASSGALLAIEKHMDIFGVNILGITTAVGGGIIRDIVLGNTPPNVFRNSSYVVVSIIVSTLLFVIMYVRKHVNQMVFEKAMKYYERLMLWMDSIGLGIFTVVGINTAVNCGYKENVFLLIFVGMVTGIGGGMMRDIMAGRMPSVFVKHIYACASLIGACGYVWLISYLPMVIAMLISAIVVVIIRVLAAQYKWNLPRI